MTQFNPTINTIHVDMDGVVAHFDQFVLEHLGRTFDHQAGPGQDTEMWTFLSTIDHLYLQLPPTEYAERLLLAALNVTPRVKMLTAIPRRTTLPTAEQDKKDWMQKYFSHLNIPVTIGPFSRDKYKHCKPGDILIDDRTDNIQEWIQAGGIGILHKTDDVENTLNLLTQYTK